jgi:hypothetical protein
MSKRLRDEVKRDIPISGGMLDLFDSLIYTFYNITSDEYDVICEKASDSELDDFVQATMEGCAISQIKKGLLVRNKYIDYFKHD